MASRSTLPLEIRLQIYEILLAEWAGDLNRPGIFSPRSAGLERPRHRVPVPAVLQAEAGEVRPRLLKWLAKHKRIVPAESTPTLRFPDREFRIRHDFLFLETHNNAMGLDFLQECLERGHRDLKYRILDWPTSDAPPPDFWFRIMPQRIAMLSPACYGAALPLLLKKLERFPHIQELAFAFVELDDGELKLIDSTPKMNPAAYTVEPIRNGDIKDDRPDLLRSVEGLSHLIQAMLPDKWSLVDGPIEGQWSRGKITACKLIPRI